jgi:hypothetical protein
LQNRVVEFVGSFHIRHVPRTGETDEFGVGYIPRETFGDSLEIRFVALADDDEARARDFTETIYRGTWRCQPL